MRTGDRLTLHNTPPNSSEFRLLCTPVVPSLNPGKDTGLSDDRREFRVPATWLSVLGIMLATDSDLGHIRGDEPFVVDRFWLWQIVKYSEDTWSRFTVVPVDKATVEIMKSRIVRPLRHALLAVG